MKEKKTRQQHILLTEWQKEHLQALKKKLNCSQSVLIRAMLNKGIRNIENALLSNKEVFLDEELIINNDKGGKKLELAKKQTQN